MKMPICMWLARHRATSRAYNEFGEGRSCGHCGSIYSEAHARARHEKQCGDRFTALGMEKIKEFSFQRPGLTRDSAKESDSSMLRNTPGCADPDQHADCCLSILLLEPFTVKCRLSTCCLSPFVVCCELGGREHSVTRSSDLTY